MKLKNNNKDAGLTLIEITLVIAVLLGLISVLFVGVSAYKEGSNRAKCIMNISNVQKAVRVYQNLNEKSVGDTLPLDSLVGSGKLLETIPACPSNGTYTTTDSVPSPGNVYLTCSLSTSRDHVPNSITGW